MSLALLLAASRVLIGAQVCLIAPDVGLCPPDDIVHPTAWTGYSTDSTTCSDPQWPGHALFLSASPWDPFVNQAGVPGDGRIYLWLIGASRSYGYSYISTTIEAHGVQISDYVPIAAGQYAWVQGSSYLMFYGGVCHRWPVEVPSQVIGAFVLETTAVDAQSWGRLKAMWR